MATNKQTAIAAAIKPYSTAVAPDSSFRNVFILEFHLPNNDTPKTGTSEDYR